MVQIVTFKRYDNEDLYVVATIADDLPRGPHSLANDRMGVARTDLVSIAKLKTLRANVHHTTNWPNIDAEMKRLIHSNVLPVEWKSSGSMDRIADRVQLHTVNTPVSIGALTHLHIVARAKTLTGDELTVVKVGRQGYLLTKYTSRNGELSDTLQHFDRLQIEAGGLRVIEDGKRRGLTDVHILEN